MNDRRTRQFLLYGVLAIGFLLPVVTSTGVLFGWLRLHTATQGRLLLRIIYQLVGLFSLYFALRYQGRKLADIGFSIKPRLWEIGRAFALFFGVIFLQAFLQAVLYLFVSPVVPWLRVMGPNRNFDQAALFGTGASLLAIAVVILNPFYEELLVRAFLITEFQGLYLSTTLAVSVSVALQTSYHLYQGLPMALSHVPIFLTFSLYYVRTRRILPVVLAHLVMDVLSLGLYAHQQHW
jgi:membrane protease YdiL (CAAX protease family)